MAIEILSGELSAEMYKKDKSKHTPSSSIKKLAEKMLTIMKAVRYIPKKGKNSFHNYKYAKEEDVVLAFSNALIEHKVYMFSSIVDRTQTTFQTKKGEHQFLISVKLEITFVDIESGESFTATFYGDGADGSDKGIYKALTGAQKYALMKTFLVATGDDPECDKERSYSSENISNTSSLVLISPQLEENIINLMKQTNTTHEGIKKWFEKEGKKIDKLSDLSKNDALLVIKGLEKKLTKLSQKNTSELLSKEINQADKE